MLIPRDQGPPPAYSSNSIQKNRGPTNLHTLPDHLLLQILSFVPLPQLSLYVRCSNRALYLYCMHLLRAAFLPVWRSKVRQGYSTDVGNDLFLPAGSTTSASTYSSVAYSHGQDNTYFNSVFRTRIRETAIFDLFISSCLKSSSLLSESSLHLLPSTSETATRDIFEWLQPKARLEDLVTFYGLQCGIFVWDVKDIEESKGTLGPIVAYDFLVTLTSRVAQFRIPLASGSVSESRGRTSRKTLVEVTRKSEGESLENLAKKIVNALLREEDVLMGLWRSGNGNEESDIASGWQGQGGGCYVRGTA